MHASRGLWLGWIIALLSLGSTTQRVAAAPPEIDVQIAFSGSYAREVELSAGQTYEISAGVEFPSKLPPNGRIAVAWSGPAADYGFRKVLHALDPDIYLVYRAPQAGRYKLSLRAVVD